MTTQLALITNDDGILAPGLAALAGLADRTGLTTVVAAPATEASGTSAGLTAAEDKRRVAVRRRSLEGLPEVPGYAVAGHPGLIALLAAKGAFGGRPDVVLSGVNRGANVGRAVLHSGTVGAALTAGINGIRALAVSLDVGRGVGEQHWETAVEVAETVLKLLWELPPGSVLNLNVPNVPVSKLGPLRRATLAAHGTVQSRVRHLDGGGLELVTVESEGAVEDGSDVALLAQGCPTVTPLHSVTEDAGLALPWD